MKELNNQLNSEEEFAKSLNKEIEASISKAPEQYLGITEDLNHNIQRYMSNRDFDHVKGFLHKDEGNFLCALVEEYSKWLGY